MTSKRKFIILALIILVVLVASVALLSLLSTPASYIWVMDRGALLNETYLVKMCSNGTRILQVQFGQSEVLGVDQRDGSVWAPELNDLEGVNYDQIVHIAADGKIVKRCNGYRTGVIAIDSNTGSIWVGIAGQIVKLNSNGESILRIAGFSFPDSIAVDPHDSSIWIADGLSAGSLVHLDANGTELFRINTTGFFSDSPHQVAVDPVDGDVWYTGFYTGNIYKLSSAGHPLAMSAGFDRPVSVSINPANGNVWVADYSVKTSGAVVRLDSDGKIIQRVILDKPPQIAVFNPLDGTVWVGIDGAMLKLSDKGEIVKTVTGFTIPKSIAFVQIPDDLMLRLKYLITCMDASK